MKKIVSIILSAVMLATMLSVGTTAFAKESVSAAKIKLANVNKGIKITWNKAKGAKRYELVRKASGAKKFSVIRKLSAKAKSFTDKKVKAGKKYTYALKAINGGASASSDTNSIIRLKAPTNVKVKAVADDFETQIKITWSKVKGAKSYKVYRSVYDGKKFGKYKLYDEAKGKTYYGWNTSGELCRYKVAACSGSSLSAMSAASSKIAVLDDVYVSLEMNKDYTGVHVAWEEEKGATGYEIYRSKGDNKNYSLLKKSTEFSTGKDEFGYDEYYYDDKDITYGEHYYYYVRAYNKYAKSKGKIEDIEDSILCREYDLLLETGEDNANDILSCLVNYSDEMDDVKTTVTSEDENIVKIKTETDAEGVKRLYLVGVSAGDTYINIKSEYEPDIGNSARCKIRVQNEPVYGAELKVGESSGTFDALNNISDFDTVGISWVAMKDMIKATATSEDESIVKVEGSDADLKLTGVSAGITKVRFKMSMKIGAVSIDLIDYTFKVKVAE